MAIMYHISYIYIRKYKPQYVKFIFMHLITEIGKNINNCIWHESVCC